jgi:hypothetical protein
VEIGKLNTLNSVHLGDGFLQHLAISHRSGLGHGEFLNAVTQLYGIDTAAAL